MSAEDPRTVLITGAAGFIGSHLAELLASEGDEVIGLDNLDPYYSTVAKARNVDIVKAAGVRFVDMDILDRDGLRTLLEEATPDVVIHLAARAGVRNSIQHPHEYVVTNVIGTQNVLDACLAAECGRVVMASTSSTYGDTTTIPFVETDPSISPRQPYAASKRAAEILASTYHAVYGLQTTVTRFFTVYGPRGRPDMMPMKLARSIRSGEEIPLFVGDFRRDWTYITDICSGLRAASHTPLGFEVVNLGRGQPESLAAFVSEIERVSGGHATLRPTEAPASEMLTTWADTTKARELLGYRPSTPMAEGVRLTWEWFAGHAEPGWR